MKYRSLFASLALIFEVVDFVDGKTQGHAVSEDNAHRAGAWCRYLEFLRTRGAQDQEEPPDRETHRESRRSPQKPSGKAGRGRG